MQKRVILIHFNHFLAEKIILKVILIRAALYNSILFKSCYNFMRYKLLVGNAIL